MSHQVTGKAIFLVSLFCLSVRLFAQEPANEGNEYFEKQIRPLFVEHCLECHSDQKHQGGLRLTSRESLLRGGDSGPAVESGKPDASLLMRAVQYLDEIKMPPKQKLPDGDIAKLQHWVSLGAPWPGNSPGRDASLNDGFRITEKQRQWWAFHAPKRSGPALTSDSWSQNEIDSFIIAGLNAVGMRPSGVADRRTWLRRVTFDLTGLPPTPDEVEAFVSDDSSQAFERVVDRLLASSAYGQAWARHWLDVVRYADYHDADGKARDVNCEPMQAWRYRDWVVDALNRDLPFDQFIVHQIAGDLLPVPDGRDFYADGLIATTFLSNGTWDRGDADKEKMVSDMVDDNIDIVGKAFLGLTLGCARCHDHKFDPIAQHDYYALAGIFYSTRLLQSLGTKGGNYTLHRVPLADRAYLAKRTDQLNDLNRLEEQLKELDKQTPKPPSDDPGRIALIAQRDQARSNLLPEPPLAEAVAEGGTPGGLFPAIQDVPVHIRGSYTRLGPVVPRRMPQFFAGLDQPPITTGSGRRELAAWVASKENPLTARVIVNRVWQWHFGQGLVRTANNFGLNSEPPLQAPLLDWLAAELMDSGWSLKRLHRQIILSATYRQSSAVPHEQVEADPDNRRFGRFVARRLDAESIRDAMLMMSDQLNLDLSGPAEADLGIGRRSLYVQTARWDRSNFSTLFDAANPDASVESRLTSTVAPQALFLLNHQFIQSQARQFAQRLIRDYPGDSAEVVTQRIQQAYRLIAGRLPSTEETHIAREILHSPTGTSAGWVDLAHVLLCCNEFVYVD